MKYSKYQLYLNHYAVSGSRVVVLPDNCKWTVMRFLGNGNFTNNSERKGKICLILSEESEEAEGFWPVISFLTREEALNLAAELKDFAKKEVNYDNDLS